MPLFRGSRPLKRWRYVGRVLRRADGVRGARSDRPRAAVVLGAVHARGEADARAHADAAPRGEVELDTGGRHGRRRRRHAPGRLRVHGRGVLLDLQLEEQAGIEALCPNGRAQVWTRKQAGVAAHGTLRSTAARTREIQRARRDRRHGRASRPPHRVALERRRRREPGRHPARLEPRQRRQRPTTGQRAGRVGRGLAAQRSRPSASPPTCRASAARTEPSCASSPRRSAAATTSC